jgi:dihydrofolate synthase/folylpolyglutamate synthase
VATIKLTEPKMNIDNLLQPFQHFGINLGLQRIQQLLQLLDNPQAKVPIIHVAGTNGKGSVCAYLSTVLTEAGYRVGRYISPHLIDWNERVCINQIPITSEELGEYLSRVIFVTKKMDNTPTQFEVITAAAWLYFAEKNVDLAVMEVGLGGRLDATNVCDQPLLSIITSISRDHWQVLGSTLGEIAGEKAGILKKNCPAIIGDLPLEAKKTIAPQINLLNCPTVWVKPSVDLGNGWAEFTPPSSPFSLYPEQYPLSLLGEFQLVNSAIAIASLQVLQTQGWNISKNAREKGMAKTEWLGRIQWTTWRQYPLLIDGAHNPQAAIVLRQYIDSLDESRKPQDTTINWVIGMLANKDHAEIFQGLLQKRDRVYLVPIPDSNYAPPEDLALLAKEICPELSHCQAYPDLMSGLDAVIACQNSLTILCGSLYLLGYFLREQCRGGFTSIYNSH